MSELKEWTASEIEEQESEVAELKEKLKVQTSIAEEGWKEFRTYHSSYAEAVKELYDKNKEIAELENRIDEGDKDFEIAYHQNERLLQIVRHQKRKRCLAMASYWVAVSYQCVDDKHRQRAEKHHRKWLDIAKRFEEAK